MEIVYDMAGKSHIGSKGVKDIIVYLKSLSETFNVINVENIAGFREKDIDLIWNRKTGYKTIPVKIEVKTDKYHNTGNYFFETISNNNKNTLGCFMYTEADFIYYYFIDTKELHILPMPETRNWFLSNINRFKEVNVKSTEAGTGFYHSVGRLININLMRNEFKNIEIVKLNN